MGVLRKVVSFQGLQRMGPAHAVEVPTTEMSLAFGFSEETLEEIRVWAIEEYRATINTWNIS